MSETSGIRRGQRQPLSCTNCARRKLRCSKVIPCTSCIDRQEGESCHREVVQLGKENGRAAYNRRLSSRGHARTQSRSAAPRSGSASQPSPSQTPTHSRPRAPVNHRDDDGDDGNNDNENDDDDGDGDDGGPSVDQTAFTRFQTSLGRNQAGIPHIQSDAVVTLEFLSHGRQNILSIVNPDAPRAVATGLSPIFPTSHSSIDGHSLAGRPPWEELLTNDQCRALLSFHEENLAWMHNVVHMPTFRLQFENYLSEGQWAYGWLALFYALICVRSTSFIELYFMLMNKY
jgi:hypothetical protein